MKAKTRRRKVRAVLLWLGAFAAVAAVAAGLRGVLGPASAPVPSRRPARSAPPLPKPASGPSWGDAMPFPLLARLDPALAPAAWGLFSETDAEQKAAALELSAHFVSSETLTGLCPEAADTLWLLSEAVLHRKGGQTVFHLLYKDLKLLADLEDYEKDDFVDTLADPMAVYIPLAVSHAPHVRESRRMFAHLRRLVEARGLSVTEWIREADPEARFAANFLLRLNAYEVLVPYLREHPGEIRAAAGMLFPDAVPAVDPADQIQNIFDSLSEGKASTELVQEFIEGCLTRIGLAPPPVRERITVFLHVNWERLSPELREQAAFVAGRPDGVVETAELRAPLPYKKWPAPQWRFTMHFADEKDFAEWERYFKAKGYEQEASAVEDTVVLARQIPDGPRVVVTAYLYASLETGMMVGPSLKRFQTQLATDLQDPGVEGVFVRAHAQFPRLPAFKKKTRAKLWYDGSCRGGWDLTRLGERCPDCVLVGNVGSGRSSVNNPMIWALIEGLGRREDWQVLYDRIKQAVPEYHTRLIGPWSTPLSKTLKRKTARPKAGPRRP